MRRLLLVTTAVSAVALAHSANAQDESEGMMAAEPATQCLEDLRTFGNQMREDGYWLTGYRQGWGWRGYGVGPGAATPPAAEGTTAMTAADGEENAIAAPVSPWGDVAWQRSPGYQLRVLYSAANVLALRGDQEGCDIVLTELRDLYGSYTEELQEAGVEPGEVTGWRRAQIATAAPVTELGQPLSIDRVIGSEIWSAGDEHLGTIEDVVLDSETGGITHVIVSYGGFLGIGGNFAAVPWERLQAPPGMASFVLDAKVSDLENAPQIDPSDLEDRENLGQRTDEIDTYWDQQG